MFEILNVWDSGSRLHGWSVSNGILLHYYFVPFDQLSFRAGKCVKPDVVVLLWLEINLRFNKVPWRSNAYLKKILALERIKQQCMWCFWKENFWFYLCYKIYDLNVQSAILSATTIISIMLEIWTKTLCKKKKTYFR